MQVMLTEPKTGQKKFLKVGFSWMLLFLAPLYGIGLFARGLHSHGAAIFILCILVVILAASPANSILGLLLIAIGIYYGVKGNELTAKKLMSKGWELPKDESAAEYARTRWSIYQ